MALSDHNMAYFKSKDPAFAFAVRIKAGEAKASKQRRERNQSDIDKAGLDGDELPDMSRLAELTNPDVPDASILAIFSARGSILTDAQQPTASERYIEPIKNGGTTAVEKGKKISSSV